MHSRCSECLDLIGVKHMEEILKPGMASPTAKTPGAPANYGQLVDICRTFVGSYNHEPIGDSDLDNEQPIILRATLGDWRMARMLLYQVEKEKS